MKRFDIHVHTCFSKCSNNPIDKIIDIAKKRNLNGIAITDHNTLEGALLLKALNKDKNFEVIIGEEVNSNIGHILVYYLKKKINPGNIKDILKEARKQNAVVILAHPYNFFSSIISKIFGIKNMRSSITNNHLEILKKFDGIEAFNSRCILKKENKMANELSRILNKTGVAGSDAHFLSEIGNSAVFFDDKYSFKEAILKNKIKYSGRRKNAIFNRFVSFLKTLMRKND